MEAYDLSFWTAFWFFVPMPLLVVWATITFFTERRHDDE